MGVDGNVWWVQILVASSLILRELLYILHWRLSISSSSKAPLLQTEVVFGCKETSQKMEEEIKKRSAVTFFYPFVSVLFVFFLFPL